MSDVTARENNVEASTETAVFEHKETIRFETTKKGFPLEHQVMTSSLTIQEETSSIGHVTSVTKIQEQFSSLVETHHETSEFLTTQSSATNSNLTIDAVEPNVVVYKGTNVNMYCPSPVDTLFRWSYRPLDGSQAVIIYNSERPNADFDQFRVSSVSCAYTQCTLTVRNLQLNDAGLFTCHKRIENKQWSITVLGKYMNMHICVCLFTGRVSVLLNLSYWCCISHSSSLLSPLPFHSLPFLFAFPFPSYLSWSGTLPIPFLSPSLPPT